MTEPKEVKKTNKITGAVHLVLGLSDDRGQVMFPSVDHALKLLDSPADREQLREQLEALTPVHDASHLETIVNWTPEGGVAVSIAVQWHDLARRINKLDKTKEGKFTLSQSEATLIWKRLRRKDYKVTMNLGYLDLVFAFMESANVEFPDEGAKDE